MKMILHLMRREVAHMRNFLLFLGALLVIVAAWHLLVVHTPASATFVNLLTLFKGAVIPGICLLCCGIMGLVDSPHRENHHLLTRPIQFTHLYLAKALLVTVIAGFIALLQSILNVLDGFPTGFFGLFPHLVFAGWAALLIAAICKARFMSVAGLSLIVFLVFIAVVNSYTWFSKHTLRQIYSPSELVIIFFIAIFALGLFILTFSRLKKPLYLGGVVILAFLIAITMPLVPRGNFKADPAALAKVVGDRLQPRILCGVDLKHHLVIKVSHLRSEDFDWNPLVFTARVVTLEMDDGSVYQIPAGEILRPEDRFVSEHHVTALAGLVASRRSMPQSPSFLNLDLARVPIPEPLRGQKATVTVQGLVHHQRLIDLGEISAERGQSISYPGLQIELIEPDHPFAHHNVMGSLFRIKHQGMAQFHLEISLGSPENKYRDFWSSRFDNEFASHGMTKVSRLQCLRRDASLWKLHNARSRFFHFQTWVDEGSAPFQSKPFELELSPESLSRKDLLLATYPVEPSVFWKRPIPSEDD